MQITDSDRLIVKNLVEEADGQERHFEHEFGISQKILGMLISDRHFLTQSLDLIKPKYFEDEGHQLICQIVFDFFKKYKTLPNKVFIANEIKERRKKPEYVYQYLGELEAVLADYVPGCDTREYLMDKIVDFAKEQAVRVAISRTVDVIKQKPVNGYHLIADLWRDALTTDKGHDLGLEYLPTLDERYERLKANLNNRSEIFSLGFDKVDSWLASKGLCRGEIGAFVGTSGAGKSIALINAAYSNLGWGKKVCYITLEMNQDKIAQRFDSLVSNHPFGTLIDNSEIVIQSIKDTYKHELDKRILVVKHYPGGTANVDTFRAYLSQLNLYGFKPDLVVIDYIGEMKDLAGYKTYESRQLLVRDLRTFAQEEDVCVLTAMQANRQGREAQESAGQIDDSAVADSFGMARPLDIMLSLNKQESASNVGSIFGIKVRDGISRQEIYYEMDTLTLKMSETSRERYVEVNNRFRVKKANLADEKVPKI